MADKNGDGNRTIINDMQLRLIMERVHEEDTNAHWLPLDMKDENKEKYDAFCKKAKSIMQKNPGRESECIFWFTLPKAPFEDFLNWELKKEDRLCIKDEDELDQYKKKWVAYYEENSTWFRCSISEYMWDTRISDRSLMVVPGRKNKCHRLWGEPVDVEPLIDLLDEKLDKYDLMCEAGTYYKHLEAHLPYVNRAGYMKLADYWKFDPGDFEKEFPKVDDDLSCKYLETLAEAHDTYAINGMTSGKFIEICDLLYETIGIKDNSDPRDLKMSPKTRYMNNADAVDDEFMNMPEDNAEAFDRWYDSGPEEYVWTFSCSPRMRLKVERDDEGVYFFALSGYKCVKDEMKCIIALLKAGYPIDMEYPKLLERKLQGNYIVGINPKGASFPSYYTRHKNIGIDEIGDRMLMPNCPKDFMKFITWLPVEAET